MTQLISPEQNQIAPPEQNISPDYRVDANVMIEQQLTRVHWYLDLSYSCTIPVQSVVYGSDPRPKQLAVWLPNEFLVKPVLKAIYADLTNIAKVADKEHFTNTRFMPFEDMRVLSGTKYSFIAIDMVDTREKVPKYKPVDDQQAGQRQQEEEGPRQIFVDTLTRVLAPLVSAIRESRESQHETSRELGRQIQQLGVQVGDRMAEDREHQQEALEEHRQFIRQTNAHIDTLVQSILGQQQRDQELIQAIRELRSDVQKLSKALTSKDIDKET